MAQIAAPISDIADGSSTGCGPCSGANNYSLLDEGISATDDGSSMSSYGDGSGDAATFIECGITSLTDPVSSTGHIIRARWAHGLGCTSPNATGQQTDLTLVLKQGTTVITTQTQVNVISGAWETFTYTLNATEANSITDYTALRLKTYKTEVGGGSNRNCNVSTLEFECPDAPSGDLTPQDIDATAVGVAALSRRLLIKRTLAPTAVGVPTVAKRTSRFRTLTSTAVGVPTVSKRTSRFRTLAATAVGVSTVTKSLFKTLTTTAVGIASMSKKMSVTLSSTASGIASLSRVSSFFRALTSTAVGVATVTKELSFFKTLTATAVGVASMSKKMSVTLSSTATGIAELVSGLSFSILLEAVSTGVATLTSTKTFGSVLEVVAVGVASMQKLVSKRLTAASTGVVTMQRLTRKTIAAVAVGVSTMADVIFLKRTLSSIALGVVDVATQLMVAAAQTPRRVIIFFRDRKKFFTRSN
jgi:hypothetical protein